jgi:SAM-dependent methyltransferase
MKQNIYDREDFYNAYLKLRESGAGINESLEKPTVRSLLPELNGLEVLDLGCGYGENCVWYVDQDAKRVVGVDISKRMIEAAEMRFPNSQIEYLCQAFEDYAYPEDAFDVVVSSMAMHYISVFDAVVAGVCKTLKFGGVFVFSQEHPMVSARKVEKGWVVDDRGEKKFWPVDNYHVQGRREDSGWVVGGAVKYHRTIEAMVTSLLNTGFAIDGIREPGLDLLEDDSNRRPPIIVFKGRKGQ